MIDDKNTRLSVSKGSELKKQSISQERAYRDVIGFIGRACQNVTNATDLAHANQQLRN